MQKEIIVEAIEFKAEYADCGSHRIKLRILVDTDEAEIVALQLKKKLEKDA